MRATPAALAPGGFACLLIAWALDPDDPAERPRSWLEGSGCDAYLLHTSTDDPIETATVWNRDLLDQPEAYAQALDRWLAYYRELGIEQLGYACLVLRKRSDGRDGWLEAQQLPRAALRPAGRHVRKLFETRDWMSEVDSDNMLLERRLRVVDDAVVTQDTRFAEGRWQAESLTLRLENGLPFSAELDATTARLIRELDGSVLRKRSDGGEGWLEAQQLPRAALRPAGRHVRKLFETHDRLSEIDADSGSSTGECASPTTPSSPRTRASRRVAGTRRTSRSGSRPGCRSPPSSMHPLRG